MEKQELIMKMSKRDTSFIIFTVDYGDNNINSKKLEKIYDSIFFSFKPDFDKDLSKYSYFLTGVGVDNKDSNSFQLFCRYGVDLWVCNKNEKDGYKQHTWQDLHQKNIRKNKKPWILIYYL